MEINKIFCIGYPKTGTTSINKALSTLGFPSAKFQSRKFYKFLKDNKNYEDFIKKGSFIKFIKRHHSFSDWPIFLFYRELDKMFPNSKFILTTRANEQDWLDSQQRMAERTEYSRINEVYKYQRDQLRRFLMDTYESHIQDVKKYSLFI